MGQVMGQAALIVRFTNTYQLQMMIFLDNPVHCFNFGGGV